MKDVQHPLMYDFINEFILFSISFSARRLYNITTKTP